MIRHQSKVLRTVLTATLGGWVAFFSASGLAHAQKVEGLELLEKVENVPGTLHRYTAQRPSRFELERRMSLAERLGKQSGVSFDAEARSRSDKSRIVFSSSQDASAVFEIDEQTANLLFNGGLNKFRKEESTPNLPDARAIVEVAKQRLRELALPLEGKEVVEARLGGLNMAVPDGQGGSLIYEKFKHVRFGRVLDGLRVEGDTRVLVQLADGGKLAGLVYQWPAIGEAQALRREELVDAKVIRELALKQIEDVARGAERSFLTEVELVLYDDGRGEIEPAYHFVIERYFGYGEDEPPQIPYDFYVPVVRASRALFPHQEVADVAPGDGRDITPVTGGRDE